MYKMYKLQLHFVTELKNVEIECFHYLIFEFQASGALELLAPQYGPGYVTPTLLMEDFHE